MSDTDIIGGGGVNDGAGGTGGGGGDDLYDHNNLHSPQVGGGVGGPMAGASSDLRQVSSLSEDSSSRNLKVETLLALVELGVIAAVFMMVAAVYIAMIGAEAGLGKMKRAYRRRFGSPDDEERCAVLDPAARVGTFKRYKN